MNHDEKLVGDWLVDQGHTVRHLENPEDPPDIVVDGSIAVEVTTIASHAFHSMWDFINGICESLGPAENGRGYWIDVSVDDEELLQGKDSAKVTAIKRDLKHYTKTVLRNHYANPDAPICGLGQHVDFRNESGRIRLPHGVELQIIGQINDNQHDLKYKVALGGANEGVLVVGHLIDTVQSAIEKKTNNRMIQERAGRYQEWWLVLTDPHNAIATSRDELQILANNIKHGTFWRRILLAVQAGGEIGRVIDLSEHGRIVGEPDAT